METQSTNQEQKNQRALIVCNVILCIASSAVAIKFAVEWYGDYAYSNIIAIALFGVVAVTLLGFLDYDDPEVDHDSFSLTK